MILDQYFGVKLCYKNTLNVDLEQFGLSLNQLLFHLKTCELETCS